MSVVRRYIDILIIIITFPYSTCISSFLTASSLFLCSLFKCFFILVYVIFVVLLKIIGIKVCHYLIKIFYIIKYILK